MRFGISTHLFHDQRLRKEHLAQIAAYGFGAVELFATRSHFDYRDPSAIDQLAQWLSESGLTLNSVHAPITEAFGTGDKWAATYSNAVSDSTKRQAAVQEAEAALQIAKRIPFNTLVVHLGTPSAKNNPGDNNPKAASKSAEELCRLAEPLGVKVAYEVIPNPISSPIALVQMLEREFEGASHVGICMDFGHAFLQGDVADAIETAAEHLIATHIHDNKGREDEHLVPYLGRINWDLALMAMQKIGYDGMFMFEVANTGSPAAVLEEARRARQRFERSLSH